MRLSRPAIFFIVIVGLLSIAVWQISAWLDNRHSKDIDKAVNRTSASLDLRAYCMAINIDPDADLCQNLTDQVTDANANAIIECRDKYEIYNTATRQQFVSCLDEHGLKHIPQ